MIRRWWKRRRFTDERRRLEAAVFSMFHTGPWQRVNEMNRMGGVWG